MTLLRNVATKKGPGILAGANVRILAIRAVGPFHYNLYASPVLFLPNVMSGQPRGLQSLSASGDIDGFVKILSDASTDEVLGVHMVGARVADLITEAVTAMEFRASAEDIARMSHAHPTYGEAVKEAALAATENRPLHV